MTRRITTTGQQRIAVLTRWCLTNPKIYPGTPFPHRASLQTQVIVDPETLNPELQKPPEKSE
jgi:hypothetical protein